MYQGKRILGLIPARGGSKGLPGKNVRPLCGRPLIEWSILRGRESRYLDDVVVTTDCAEIAETSRRAGASVPFLRPPELATDTATTLVAVNHALEFLEQELGQSYDYVFLLQPTSPLREPDDIDRMIVQLIDAADRFDSIIAVGEVGEHPSIMKRKVGQSLEPFHADLKRTTRRQDNEPAYYPYGVGYMVRIDTLREEGTFYSERNTFFDIKRYQHKEIDDLYDFICIEALMRYEWGLS